MMDVRSSRGSMFSASSRSRKRCWIGVREAAFVRKGEAHIFQRSEWVGKHHRDAIAWIPSVSPWATV